MSSLKKMLLLPLLAVAVLTSCRIEPAHLREEVRRREGAQETAAAGEENVVFRFFDDDYMPGGFSYAYPATSSVAPHIGDGVDSETSLRFIMEKDDFSGGAVCLYNMTYNLTPYRETGVLRLWVKATTGKERFLISLVDDDGADGNKTVVRAQSEKYGTLIPGEWVRIDVPLRDYPARGVYWDAEKRVEVPNAFGWDAVEEFRIETRLGENPDGFNILVDNIQIVRDAAGPAVVAVVEEAAWGDKVEVVNGPENPQVDPPEQIIATFFGDDFAPGGFPYVYGGKTAARPQESQTPGNEQILATYQDDLEYSGVSISLGTGTVVDVTNYRREGGLQFWVKGALGGEVFHIGILDDEADGPGRKVQTRVMSQDAVRVTNQWQLVKVPFRNFSDYGLWWDVQRQAEVRGQVQWDRIQEVRFSVNKFANRTLIEHGTPATLYFDQIQLVRKLEGVYDKEAYWAEFKSDAADVVISDFTNNAMNQQWDTPSGQNSDISAEFVDVQNKPFNRAMAVTFRLRDWADAVYSFRDHNSPAKIRDWSKHWGISFWFYTEKPFAAVTVQSTDSGNEVFFHTVGGRRGWTQIIVPFKKLEKFPYWQPDDAQHNGIFDRNGIVNLAFKPANDGTQGTFLVADVRLTNLREVERVKEPERLGVTISGNTANVIQQQINRGIYGINVALWNGDMLRPETVKFANSIKHHVYRYPGGLRADEDHWEEVLAARDWMVDTDEYTDWLRSVNGVGMITVNFGTGTPEEAARWVEHTNIKRNDNIRYWEIGNEIYGSWHPHRTTADDYGRRARVFIEKMKAVDPTIQVTVVWEIEADWNRIVFEHTKDIADGVNVHHYPQHWGQENDFALLSSPQLLPRLIGGVRDQVKRYGVPGRDYVIWWTEWNSVNFNPGPQTVSVVNGLFVADYLAMLAVTNPEIANFWGLHNDITPEGGDYGYLSRTGAPDGDNVPRPSYWAFKLVANNLQGQLLEVGTGNESITSYLAKRKDGSYALLVINKSPYTDFDGKINIRGLRGGNAIVETFHKIDEFHSLGFNTDITEIKTEDVTSLANGDTYRFRRHTATVIQWGTEKSHTDFFSRKR